MSLELCKYAANQSYNPCIGKKGGEMEYMGFVWLGLLVIFLLIEMATVGLVTIWMAGGALAALILELAGLSFGGRLGISDRIFCFAHIYTAVCGEIHKFPPRKNKL